MMYDKAREFVAFCGRCMKEQAAIRPVGRPKLNDPSVVKQNRPARDVVGYLSSVLKLQPDSHATIAADQRCQSEPTLPVATTA